MASDSRKIYINGRFVTRRVTGVERYAWEMLRALDQLVANRQEDYKRFELTLLVPRDAVPPKLTSIRVERKGRWKGNLWEQLDLPRLARRGALVWNPCNTGPIFCQVNALTIHDAGVFDTPRAYSRLFRLWYRWLWRLTAKRARGLLTVSEFSKSRLSTRLRVPAERWKVIAESGEHATRVASSVAKRRAILDEGFRYVLSVSSLNPNKNFKLVMEAARLCGDLPIKFLVAGARNDRVFSEQNVEGPGNIEYLGYITDEELRDLYENALCFVYPSIYEGFGLPPLEAMSCGCPVVAARAASLPEVCGDAAMYVDPTQPKELMQAIRQLMTDETFRQDLRERGHRKAAAFSWARSAAELLVWFDEMARTKRQHSVA